MSTELTRENLIHYLAIKQREGREQKVLFERLLTQTGDAKWAEFLHSATGSVGAIAELILEFDLSEAVHIESGYLKRGEV